MNKSQWNVLSLVFIFLMMLFIYIDLSWNLFCGDSYRDNSPVTAMDVTACVRAEVYSLFIWLFFVLFIAFQICSWLERMR